MTIAETIKAHAQAEAARTPGVEVYRSSVGPFEGATDLDARVREEGGWSEVESFSDWPLRVVWANRHTRELLTYCEGDVTLDVANDANAWESLMRSCREFYARYV